MSFKKETFAEFCEKSGLRKGFIATMNDLDPSAIAKLINGARKLNKMEAHGMASLLGLAPNVFWEDDPPDKHIINKAS